MQYIGYFIFAFFLSLFITAIVRMVMQKYHIVDIPRTKTRKIHKKKIPLGGGLAIFISFFLIIFLLLSNSFGQEILPKHIWGLFFGGLVLMVGGILDDKYNLKAKYQILFPILAALTVILFGIGPHEITNPLGGVFTLDQWVLSVGTLGNWVVLADTLVFCWLMGMMFTTKFLDGLDGLVTGVVSIGAMMIFFLSLQAQWYQPEVALFSIVFAGCCLGFLVWNWHPAKIFLGEGGSLFTGFMIGSLAIISGGKIATTLLVMGIPALDVIRVIMRRIQKKKPIHIGDNEHLHFKLIESGLTQRQAVLLMYVISFLFGVTTLFLQSSEKLVALVFLFILMLLLGVWFGKKSR
ncbi:MAG: hypothetical protein COX81_00335 [Candidatus Magasanikbacteria bacterium CG_4_10_14_0_2_um_filter_37_12]|uniref:Undecaprenyl-phosphate alpha-N-acetylglucosaminyl 1-phosphate transferase n=1 Tax=Candidatus Magasanikbacteria bacterium CG_4_10_14_0_2_um_filter_37_12 TaxID=1974637 RepID=A0A2M7VA03_9BACT|nr:MAG: hypothetical protein COX81_00335 [Candidatus Magasanikbacteria bacterium CG_4_10_14_0_2_um_filter_37_12]